MRMIGYSSKYPGLMILILYVDVGGNSAFKSFRAKQQWRRTTGYTISSTLISGRSLARPRVAANYEFGSDAASGLMRHWEAGRRTKRLRGHGNHRRMGRQCWKCDRRHLLTKALPSRNMYPACEVVKRSGKSPWMNTICNRKSGRK